MRSRLLSLVGIYAAGSAFTTASEKNPTLTILALAWRATDYMAGEMKRGECVGRSVVPAAGVEPATYGL